MDKESTKYTFGFALIICVVCSFSLALVSEGLRSRRELNEVLDVKKNILKVVGLGEEISSEMAPKQILSFYDQKIKELVIDKEGNVVENKKPEDILDGQELYPFYIYHEEDGVQAYCFPIIGKGLWSTLYGYFAVESDGMTVRGITFYKHGETPGLGGEISSEGFQKNFKGKKIYDIVKKKSVPIQVVKGKAQDQLSGAALQYAVDGISGATMTCVGVNKMLEKWIRVYDAYFEKVRKNNFE